jgi:hypothetical protein
MGVGGVHFPLADLSCARTGLGKRPEITARITSGINRNIAVKTWRWLGRESLRATDREDNSFI